MTVVALGLVVQTSIAGAESNGGVRVMPLGDSITDGFNVAGGYRIDLWQKLVAATTCTRTPTAPPPGWAR